MRHFLSTRVLLMLGLCLWFDRKVAGSSASSSSGCFLSSHEYLTASYFNNHDSLHDSDFHDFLNQKIGSNGSCKRPVDNNVVGVSDLRRILIGEGSHRHLVSTVKFDMQSDAWSSVDDHSCEAIIIERLPVGVFADPFELQHLVERRVFLRAAVFGDTNLELPSTLSNRSIVEIHMVIRNNTASKSSETVVQLPLHARYLPLNPSGYARVVIGNPDLFLRCRPKDLKYRTYSWSVTNLHSESNSVTWRVPCGNEELTGIVSRITFISAWFCSLLLVSSAIYIFQE